MAILLNWTNRVTGDEIRIYRDTQPFTVASLPDVLVTISATATSHEDTTEIIAGTTYYYAVGVVSGSPEKISLSEVIAIAAEIDQAPAPLFVGSTKGKYRAVDGATIDLTSLTGGIDTQPSDDDVIVLCVMNEWTFDVGYAALPSGMTVIGNADAHDSYEVWGRMAYQIASGTTSLTVAGGSGQGVAYGVMVFRNIDLTTVVDTAGAATATAVNTSNPPAVTFTPNAAEVTGIYMAASAVKENAGAQITDPSATLDFVDTEWGVEGLSQAYYGAVGFGYKLPQSGGLTMDFGITTVASPHLHASVAIGAGLLPAN